MTVIFIHFRHRGNWQLISCWKPYSQQEGERSQVHRAYTDNPMLSHLSTIFFEERDPEATYHFLFFFQFKRPTLRWRSKSSGSFLPKLLTLCLSGSVNEWTGQSSPRSELGGLLHGHLVRVSPKQCPPPAQQRLVTWQVSHCLKALSQKPPPNPVWTP